VVACFAGIDKRVGGNFVVEVSNSDKDGFSRIILDLSQLPVVNRMYTRTMGTSEEVLKTAYKLLELEAQHKVANYFYKKVKESFIVETTGYTVEQLDLLKEHGLDSYLQYVGVDNKVAEKNENDFYYVRELEFQVKGMVSLPSMNDVLKKIKESGKLNAGGVLMKEYITLLQQRLPNVVLLDEDISFEGAGKFFEDELYRIKSEILNLRIDLAAMKIGKILTGDWFDGLTPDGKGGYTYTSTTQNMVLVIKTDRTKVYF
jgi:hypothetical protein